MNDTVIDKDPIDQLDPKALLRLASDISEGADRTARYALPDTSRLANAFPELEVIELIGSGGMGFVYRTRQLKLERDVALKILPGELAEDDRFAERFSREARAMARLNHPNIVSIHDFGDRSGLHYLMMEHMDGMNLRELLDTERLSPLDVVGIFSQICEALDYAHSEGVVHRDIKPENILFNKNGNIALADFGLARLATDSSGAVVSLTQTRQAMGTLNYMAPEQWESPREVDHRADIYSLGVLLYELLTGRVPRGSFPPASTLSDASADLDEVINQALQVDAAARQQSVAELRAAVLESEGSYRPEAFDQNGTFTNLVHAGEKVLRAIPKPQRLLQKGSDYRQAIWINLVAGLCIFGLSLAPWLSTERTSYIGMETYTVIQRVQIPISLLPIASLALVLLAIGRRLLHPLRADLLSILIIGLAITQTALALNDLYPFREPGSRMWHQLTICPFLALLILCIQALETLVRLGRTLFTPLADWVQKNVEEERARKVKRQEKWRLRWQGFVHGWHDLTRRRSDK